MLDLDRLISRFSDAAIAVSTAGSIERSNKAARELLGLPASAVHGAIFWALLEPHDLFGNRLPAVPFPYVEMLLAGETANPSQVVIRTAEAERQRVTVSVVLVVDRGTDEALAIFVMRPVFRRRRADEAIDRILRMPELRGRLAKRLAEGRVDGATELTERQREVLRLLAEGLPNGKIAARLCVSENTVRSHIQNVFKRLGVHSKSEAVARAFRLGVL